MREEEGKEKSRCHSLLILISFSDSLPHSQRRYMKRSRKDPGRFCPLISKRRTRRIRGKSMQCMAAASHHFFRVCVCVCLSSALTLFFHEGGKHVTAYCVHFFFFLMINRIFRGRRECIGCQYACRCKKRTGGEMSDSETNE